MATRASKLKKQEIEALQNKVVVRVGRKEKEIIHSGLAETIRAAYGLTLDLKAMEPSLKEYKSYIVKTANDFLDENGTVSFIVDDIVCKVTFGYECVVPEEKVEELKRILGERFYDLVRIKTRYEGTAMLIELACDGDKGREIASCIVVNKKSPAIRFEKHVK